MRSCLITKMRCVTFSVLSLLACCVLSSFFRPCDIRLISRSGSSFRASCLFPSLSFVLRAPLPSLTVASFLLSYSLLSFIIKLTFRPIFFLESHLRYLFFFPCFLSSVSTHFFPLRSFSSSLLLSVSCVPSIDQVTLPFTCTARFPPSSPFSPFTSFLSLPLYGLLRSLFVLPSFFLTPVSSARLPNPHVQTHSSLPSSASWSVASHFWIVIDSRFAFIDHAPNYYSHSERMMMVSHKGRERAKEVMRNVTNVARQDIYFSFLSGLFFTRAHSSAHSMMCVIHALIPSLWAVP